MTREVVARQLRENGFTVGVASVWSVGVATLDVVFGVVTFILFVGIFVIGYACGRTDRIKEKEEESP